MTPQLLQAAALALGMSLTGLPFAAPDLDDLGWPEAGARPLYDLLPETTAVAVEIRDLERRWPEIRRTPGIARALGRLLEGSGLVLGDLPALAGERALVAFVVDPARRSLLPVALLRPRRKAEATAFLERAGASAGFAVRSRGGALWIVPEVAADRLDRVLHRSPGGLARVLPFDLATAALPPGGLSVGRLNPAALRALLLGRVPGTRPPPVELLESLLAAELGVARHVAFRRELVEGALATEAVVAYSADQLPPAVARALRAAGPPVLMPTAPPAGALAVAGFCPQPEAMLAWLRHVSRSDPRGPWRNFEFWLDELERRTGFDLARELAATLGERGWLLVLDRGAKAPRVAVLVETPDAARLERALLAVRSWMLEQTWGWSLGLLLPRTRTVPIGDHVLHRASFRTPLGSLSAAAFLVADGHLVLGSDEAAVAAGLALLAETKTWRLDYTGDEGPAPPRLSLVARGSLLLVPPAARVGGTTPGLPKRFAEAARSFLREVDSARLSVWYEEDGLRARGRIRFRNG